MSPARTGTPIIFTSCGAAVLLVTMVLGVANGAARSTEERLAATAPAAVEQPVNSTLRLEKTDASGGIL